MATRGVNRYSERPADNIKTLAGYLPHLCELAYNGHRADPAKCVLCDSKCKYGSNFLRDLAVHGLIPPVVFHARHETPFRLVDQNPNLTMKQILSFAVRHK